MFDDILVCFKALIAAAFFLSLLLTLASIYETITLVGKSTSKDSLERTFIWINVTAAIAVLFSVAVIG